MERIEDLVLSGVQAQYKGLYRRDLQQVGDAWLPSLPLPFYHWRVRWSDAWLVWSGRATAVQWPEQRDYRREAQDNTPSTVWPRKADAS